MDDTYIKRSVIIDRLKFIIEKGVASNDGLHPVSAEVIKAYIESLEPDDVIPVKWVKERIERRMADENEFSGLVAVILQAMLTDWEMSKTDIQLSQLRAEAGFLKEDKST